MRLGKQKPRYLNCMFLRNAVDYLICELAKHETDYDGLTDREFLTYKRKKFKEIVKNSR